MDGTLEWERPSKRIKLDSEEQFPVPHGNDIPMSETKALSSTTTGVLQVNSLDPGAAMEAQALKESEVGIAGYVSSKSEGFTGILKKRYTDFLVNEILPSGEVCHLKNTKAPKGSRRETQAHSKGDDTEPVKVETERDDLVNHAKNVPVDVKTEEVNGVEQHSTTNGENRASEAMETVQLPDREPNQVSVELQKPLKEDEISSDDRALLVSYLNETAVTELLILYAKILANPNVKPKEHGTVRTDFTSDRSIRGQIHQAIRRIFSSRIDSSTDNDGVLILSAALPSYRQPRNQPGRGGYGGGRDRGGKPTWVERGGNFLHFSLFKENKDTMEVVGFLAKQLKTKPKDFQFAGTKDRRAVTVQRVSAYRLDAERVASLNRMLRGSQVGDFEYHTQGLELGDLKGNEFVITLRECQFPSLSINYLMAERLTVAKTEIANALDSLHKNGFTNYYGLQRFGTFSTRTDTIGTALLQGNFKLACDLVLAYTRAALTAAQDLNSGTTHASNTTAIGQDDKSRALAIHMFESGERDIRKILDTLPYKFSAESSIIRHLHRQPTDHAGALQQVPRNLKLMYVHAYQSMIWNFAATKRQELHGSRVVAGDLVLVNEHKDKDKTTAEEPAESIDADGEVVIAPGNEDRSNTAEAMFERARPLSAAEAESGAYGIFDVVLPQPGFDVLYPSNEVGAFYKDFMASDAGGGLDPDDMRRKVKDFSLSGSYRKVRARIAGEWDLKVRSYGEDSQQFVETDLEVLRRAGGGGGGYQGLSRKEGVSDTDAEEGDKIAVVLKFQLGSSQYATMALRELMRGGVVAHKPDFGGRG